MLGRRLALKLLAEELLCGVISDAHYLSLSGTTVTLFASIVTF